MTCTKLRHRLGASVAISTDVSLIVNTSLLSPLSSFQFYFCEAIDDINRLLRPWKDSFFERRDSDPAGFRVEALSSCCLLVPASSQSDDFCRLGLRGFDVSFFSAAIFRKQHIASVGTFDFNNSRGLELP